MSPIPSPLPSMANFISELTDGGTYIEDDLQSMSITEMTLDLPIEFNIEHVDEQLTLRSGPPTQRTATSILPVFHRLRVRITQTSN